MIFFHWVHTKNNKLVEIVKKWIHLGHFCDEWIHLCVHTCFTSGFFYIFIQRFIYIIRQQMSLSLFHIASLHNNTKKKKRKTKSDKTIINLFQSLLSEWLCSHDMMLVSKYKLRNWQVLMGEKKMSFNYR